MMKTTVPLNHTMPLTNQYSNRFIEKAHNLVKRTGQPGIHFDIHGYTTHPDLWFELGYLIDNDDLDSGKLRRFQVHIMNILAYCANNCRTRLYCQKKTES